MTYATRFGARIAAIALFSLLAACAGGDLADSQTDPLTTTARSSPNWALAAPKEAATAAAPTLETPVFATGPQELLDHLDRVASADGRVERAAAVWPGSDAHALRTRVYVQRSEIFGFPDVISVVALDLGTGDAGQRASLVIYSSSVYGYSDFGVNEARLERWLSALSTAAPVVAGRNAQQ